MFHDWDWAAAAREFDRALALDSTEARTHLFHAWYYTGVGRLEDALREVRTAQRLDPLSPIINARVGSVLYYMRRYDEAAATLRQAIELDSTNASARAELGRVLVQEHRYPEALAAFSNDLDIGAGILGWGAVGYADGVAGRRTEALAIQRRVEQCARERYIDPDAFIFVALGLGDTARAFDWLERGYRQRTFYLAFLGVDLWFEPLHGNPRFEHVIRGIGLTIAGKGR